MDKKQGRLGFQSIYKQYAAPENTDNIRVAGQHTGSCKKAEKSFIDIRRQKQRDLHGLSKVTEAFKNIERDNARQAYIKKLLEDTD